MGRRMDPVTIIAGGTALYLLVKGLGNKTPTPAQQATQQGESVIDYTGSLGTQSVANAGNVSAGIATKEFGALAGGAGAGVGAGFAAAGASGAAAGAVTGAVTFGVGALVGLAAALWAKHEQRIKGAKTENAASNMIVPAWVESMYGINAAYNAGQIDSMTAVAELRDLRARVFNAFIQYNHQPGVNWAGGGSQPGLAGSPKYWSVGCSKHCTIGCCIFNNVIGPAIANSILTLLGKQRGPVNVPVMSPSPKYGFKGQAAFSLTWASAQPVGAPQPPTGATGTA